MDGAMELFEFLSDLRSDRGIADIGVDLALEGHADAHGLKRTVMDIGGDDGASRATSLRTSSGSIFSRRATYSISSVTMPRRAKCICERLREPFSGGALRQTLFYPGISDGHEVTPLFRLGNTLSYLPTERTNACPFPRRPP